MVPQTRFVPHSDRGVGPGSPPPLWARVGAPRTAAHQDLLPPARAGARRGARSRMVVAGLAEARSPQRPRAALSARVFPVASRLSLVMRKRVSGRAVSWYTEPIPPGNAT